MKTIFFALLTTLFVSAMPLQAAYANGATSFLANNQASTTLVGDQTYKDEIGTPPACVTIEGSITPEVRDIVASHDGTIIELTGVAATAFQNKLEEIIGSKAPFHADPIVLVRPAANADDYNVGFFEDNCLKGFVRIPAAGVNQLLGIANQVPAGEKVD